MARIFGATSTTNDVLEGISLAGKRVLVTGVSAGLGVETARALCAHGAEVIGTARDLLKAKKACDPITAAARAGDGRFSIVPLDLASLASVRDCADALLRDGKGFDVIIANAGVMATPYGRTADGFEIQFGTNHLGHFVLINRLVPLLGPGSRVVCLSSLAHHYSDIDLSDPNFERTAYNDFIAYGRSKTANALFAVAFDRRHRQEGIRAASVHPGSIATELSRHMSAEVLSHYPRPKTDAEAVAVGYKTVPQGAATSVWAAVFAEAGIVGGRYCEDCHVADLDPDPKARNGVAPYALDPDRAEALWALSEKMVGERF